MKTFVMLSDGVPIMVIQADGWNALIAKAKLSTEDELEQVKLETSLLIWRVKDPSLKNIYQFTHDSGYAYIEFIEVPIV